MINRDHVAKGFWGVRNVLFLDLGGSYTDVHYVPICYFIYL